MAEFSGEPFTRFVPFKGDKRDLVGKRAKDPYSGEVFDVLDVREAPDVPLSNIEYLVRNVETGDEHWNDTLSVAHYLWAKTKAIPVEVARKRLWSDQNEELVEFMRKFQLNDGDPIQTEVPKSYGPLMPSSGLAVQYGLVDPKGPKGRNGFRLTERGYEFLRMRPGNEDLPPWGRRKNPKAKGKRRPKKAKAKGLSAAEIRAIRRAAGL